MEIIIPLPQCKGENYQEFKSYLKQLELAVHHAQKSVERAEQDGIEITQDSFITFEDPMADESNRMLENVELRINLEKLN